MNPGAIGSLHARERDIRDAVRAATGVQQPACQAHQGKATARASGLRRADRLAKRGQASVEASARDARMTGTIKRIVQDKGFGFITPDDGTEDVFFHRSRLAPRAQFEDLREGDQVEFQTRPGEKGPQAFNVKVR